ncbi:MAG: amino acid racemase [Pirellulales bacterium]
MSPLHGATQRALTDDVQPAPMIGILGGMGPFATLHFYRQFLQETPTQRDSDHVRVVIDMHMQLPSRTRAVRFGEESPVEGMVDAIRRLARYGANFVLVPCNSAHYFHDQVSKRVAIPWLNMIDATQAALERLNVRRPLLLGGYVTVSQRLYGDSAVYLADQANELVYGMIEEIKRRDRLSPESLRQLHSILDEAERTVGFDAILLACTELSAAAHELKSRGVPIVDSNRMYARAALERLGIRPATNLSDDF